MTKVEPLKINTTRERLATALAVINELKAYDRALKEDAGAQPISSERLAEIQSILDDHKEESKAIYYTLRLDGADESEFAEKILEVTVDEIYVSVEQISETEVRCFYLPTVRTDTAEATT